MKEYAPMQVATVGHVADVIMGGRRYSGRGTNSYSSRSNSGRPKRTR